MKIIELTEETAGLIGPNELTTDEALLVLRKYASQLEVAFPTIVSPYYQIRSKGYVGHLPVSKYFVIRIAPKVPVSNIFRMLEYAYDLKSFRLFKGRVQIETLNDLYEGLASILARRVLDRTRKGLYSSYVKETTALPFVRGRIRIDETLRSVAFGSAALCCEYEEHTADLEENRILLWTLFCLRKLHFKNLECYNHVRRAYHALAGSIALEQKEAADCFGRSYHRLNDDYQPMHMLCGLFLERLGPGLLAGKEVFLPFMLNMPQLFEKFVARWLEENVAEEIWVDVSLSERVEATVKLTLKMDIVLKDKTTGEVLAIIDTKYKTDEQPKEADIYQIVTYAVQMNARTAILVYPSSSSKPMQAKIRGVLVLSLVFDINQPDLGGSTFLDQLTEALSF